MYKPVESLVNGEIIRDLLDLCNDYFINSGYQPYAGANHECFFCGATENKNGKYHHSAADCPVIKYMEIVKEHSRWIVKK